MAERPLDGCNLSISDCARSSSEGLRRLLLTQTVAAELQGKRIAYTSLPPERFSSNAVCHEVHSTNPFSRRFIRNFPRRYGSPSPPCSDRASQALAGLCKCTGRDSRNCSFPCIHRVATSSVRP